MISVRFYATIGRHIGVKSTFETGLTNITASARMAHEQAVSKFEASMREVKAIRALATKIADLNFVDGILCSAKANSLVTDYDVKVGCGCHPEPGDDDVEV